MATERPDRSARSDRPVRSDRPRRSRPPKNAEGRMPVMDHLRELRRRMVIMLAFIAVGAVLGWYLYPHTLHILEAPYCAVPGKFRVEYARHQGCSLIYTGVLDGFTTRLKVAVISGAVFTAPFWLYQIWAFVTPGLRKHERRYSLVFIFLSTVLFLAGCGLAYLLLSKGLKVLLETAGYGVRAQLTAPEYISFVTLALVAFGSALEVPLLVALANFVGVLPARVLKKSQRVAIFLIFLFAAVATPSTDPFTMCAMAIPMVALFEGAVLFAILHDRRKARRKAAAELAANAAAAERAAVPAPVERSPLPAAALTADRPRPRPRPDLEAFPVGGGDAWSDVT